MIGSDKNIRQSALLLFSTAVIASPLFALETLANPSAPSAPSVTSKSPTGSPVAKKDQAPQTVLAPPGPSLSDQVTGAKTTDELMHKLALAYDKHDSGAYLALIKAPLRERAHLQIQFIRDAHHVARNFRYVTVEAEKARLAKSKVVGNEDKSAYSLPVVGYIDFDLKAAPDADPIVIGLAVGQSKGNYYIVTHVSAAPAH